MQKLENSTLQKFFTELIRAIKSENEERRYCKKSKKELDIPFLVSTLLQSMTKNEEKYKEFLSDLEKYSDYQITIHKSNNDWNGIVDAFVDLIKYTNDEDMRDYDIPGFNYELQFFYDERYWGYCQCTPDMEDYREDKQCCGHGCDATFCSFSLHKILNLGTDSWHGDEHDYWDFEDEFYASDKELADKKAEEDRLRKIKNLKETIEEATKKLAELEGE